MPYVRPWTQGSVHDHSRAVSRKREYETNPPLTTKVSLLLVDASWVGIWSRCVLADAELEETSRVRNRCSGMPTSSCSTRTSLNGSKYSGKLCEGGCDAKCCVWAR